MMFELIQAGMAAAPFLLIAGTIYAGWKVLWRLFDDMFREVQEDG